MFYFVKIAYKGRSMYRDNKTGPRRYPTRPVHEIKKNLLFILCF